VKFYYLTHFLVLFLCWGFQYSSFSSSSLNRLNRRFLHQCMLSRACRLIGFWRGVLSQGICHGGLWHRCTTSAHRAITGVLALTLQVSLTVGPPARINKSTDDEQSTRRTTESLTDCCCMTTPRRRRPHSSSSTTCCDLLWKCYRKAKCATF